MRRALTSLGMQELFPLSDGENERTHESLVQELQAWSSEVEPGQDVTVAIYATGHGLLSSFGREWLLAGKDSTDAIDGSALHPTRLATAVNQSGVRRVMLILDACYAGEGAIEAFASAGSAFHQAGGDRELCILAATPSYEEAQQGIFADAFAKACRQASVPSWHQQFLSLESVEQSLAESTSEWKQKPQVWIGRDAGSLILPNPAYFPTEVPALWGSRGWTPWSSAARGVSGASDPGWFFTGRAKALDELWGHVCEAERARPAIVFLTGPAGSGRTAILARMLTTATAADRAVLPIVARKGTVPPIDVTAVAVSCAGKTLKEIHGEAVLQLGSDPLASSGHPSRPWAVLLDDTDRAEEPASVLGWADRLATVGGTVVAVVDRVPDAVSGHRIDLGAETHDSLDDARHYLSLRLRLSSPAADEFDLQRVTASTGGSWAAAVRAAEAWASAPDPYGSRVDRALRAAADSLSSSRVRTLVGRGMDRTAAATAISVLDQVSGWDEWAGLSVPLWAALASCPGGPPCDADVLMQAVPALALDCPECSTDAVRVPNPTPEASGAKLLDRLLVAVRPGATYDWRQVDPAALCALVGGAASNGNDAILLDVGLLLACPSPAVARALATRDDVRELRLAFSEVPAVGPRATRELALRVAAARRGLTGLRDPHPQLSDGLGSTFDVVAATRFGPGDQLSDIVASSVVTEEEPVALAVATAHDDGQLAVWGGDPLTRQATCPPPFGSSAIAGLVASRSDGHVRVIAMSARGDLAHWTPGDTRASALPGSASALLALDGTALLLGQASAVEVRDLTDGTTAQLQLSGTLEKAVAVRRPQGWVVWTAEPGGVLRRHELNDTGAARTSAPIVALPGLSILQVSGSGDAIAVNGAGVTIVSADGERTRSLPIPAGGSVRSAMTTPAGEVFVVGLGADGSRLVWTSRDSDEPLMVHWPEELYRVLAAGPRPPVVLVGRRSLTFLYLGRRAS